MGRDMWRKCRNLAKPVSIHTPVWGVTVYVFVVTLKGSDNFFEKRLFLEDFLLNRLNLCEGVGRGGAIVCIDFFGVGGRECWRRWGFVCIFVVSKLASKTT